ncbi:MAG: glycosyltransferase family 2 protein, partial [Gammaproteobacteria bacterium]|nr:glycosyltransferase family 2 protein [Gammaproteobacteria bacterium]
QSNVMPAKAEIQSNVMPAKAEIQSNVMPAKAGIQKKIKLIKSPKNLGFGRANNLAAQHASGKFLYLLNPDAYLSEKEALKRLVDFLEQHPQFGVVGTRIVSSRGEAETYPKTRHTGEKIFKDSFKSLKGSIAWVIGASMAIPKHLFDEIKGFDPDFFLYGEDEDLCLRVRKLGYEIGYCPEVTVEHYDAGSEQKTTSYELACKKQKALILFYEKHFSPADVVTLLTRELRLTSMRLFFHQLRSFLHLSPSPESQSRYRAIRDINREFLAHKK